MFGGITDLVYTVLIAIVVLVVIASVLFFLYDSIVTLLTGES